MQGFEFKQSLKHQKNHGYQPVVSNALCSNEKAANLSDGKYDGSWVRAFVGKVDGLIIEMKADIKLGVLESDVGWPVGFNK